MEKKLEVKNLKISFRTANGKVQAVRDISFDLHKGETLAIVGESGSGKSVTSKSMLGILAGNAIIESGEIIYDGKDLLKLTEDEFYRIRGDRIAMIFQDPMSSLNPIMRIGKQLTEAMILKGKARQRSSKKAFNSTLKLLSESMVNAIANGEYEKLTGKTVSSQKSAVELTQMCKNFDSFEFKHIELEQAYTKARESAIEAIAMIDDVLFLIEKNAFVEPREKINEITSAAKMTCNEYVVSEDKDQLLSLLSSVVKGLKENKAKGDYSSTAADLASINEILKKAVAKEQPNFFRMGYYLKFSGKELPDMPVDQLNEYLLKYLNDNFMYSFLADAQIALRYSALLSVEKKKRALVVADQVLKMIAQSKSFNRNEVMGYANALIDAVEDSIDRLEIHKDNIAYTFKTSLTYAVNNYFGAIKKNKATQKQHDKQQAKFDKIVARGKTPDWKVIPAALIDLEMSKQDIVSIIERLVNHYNELLEKINDRDFDKETVDLVDFFKLNASESVYKVTQRMAKHKAIKLMEEVGIPEPRKRFKQYPFEFSGGMRQRMVIAVALAANPDILICDEPTTALDVTIQAQILELINKIKAERQLSIIFITHDLGVVANMADRIAVMYAGKIVECGTAEDVFYSPAHPYTWALLSSMPDLDTNERLEAIPGTPPNMIYPPVGDAFADRNKYALEIDYELQPPMFKISETHSAATWLLHENAPKVDPPKIVTDRIERMRKRGGEQ